MDTYEVSPAPQYALTVKVYSVLDSKPVMVVEGVPDTLTATGAAVPETYSTIQSVADPVSVHVRSIVEAVLLEAARSFGFGQVIGSIIDTLSMCRSLSPPLIVDSP